MTSLLSLGQAGRVVVRGDRVDHLDPTAVGADPGDRLGQGHRGQSLVIHGHVDHAALVGAEHPEGADIGRRLHQDNVPGVAERAHDEVQGHLGPGGDHDVVGMCLDPHRGHDVEDLLPQLLVALARPVLQRGGTPFADEPGDRLAHRVEVQGRDERHAAGQGHHLRSTGDREQCADLGGRQAMRPLGIAGEPRVEARARAHVPRMPDGRWAHENGCGGSCSPRRHWRSARPPVSRSPCSARASTRTSPESATTATMMARG